MNLLFAVLLLQARNAEETFKLLESTLSQAKTVRVDYATEIRMKRGAQEAVVSIDGTLRLKEGNRAHLIARTKIQGMEEENITVSDGQRVRVRRGTRDSVTKDAPKDFVADLQTLFLRGGVFLSFSNSQKGGARTTYEVTALRHGEDDRDAKTLLYTLRFPEGELDCALRYDPRTSTALSRSMKARQGGNDVGTITETYKDFSLGADLPDETFALVEPSVEEQALGKAAAKLKSLAIHQMAGLHTSLGAYEIDGRRNPTTDEGLQALLAMPAEAKNWKGPYLTQKSVPLDPWGNPYVYRCPGVRNPKGYDLFSSGPDGKPGTADDVGP